MPDPLGTISTRRTPQSEAASPAQRKNSAGGYTFTIDEWTRLNRFLTLGVDGGTYYVSAPDLAKDNAQIVLHLARTEGTRMVEALLDISLSGRAPKQNPTLFALAAVSALGDDDARRAAADALPKIARTGTHLFLFAGYVEQFRGWGRGLRRSVASWYTGMDTDKLAYQVAKYRQREGWSHRDLLRLSHPVTEEVARKDIFDWVCGRGSKDSLFLTAVDAVATLDDDAAVSRAVREHRLSWEMLPSDALNSVKVWEALLDNGLPQTALMRQLPRLTKLGIIKPMGERTREIAKQLSDPGLLAKARVHPINVLVALRTYASGRSARGTGEWTPVREIVDALDAAFYAAFGAVEPSGKRTMLALDVSGSMTQPVSGLPLTCREASAALALVTAATEDAWMMVGFTGGGGGWGWRDNASLTPLTISPRMRLDDAIESVSHLPFGGTDCALPMVHALKEGLLIDTFVVLTDNETWAGSIHPHQALAEYRRKTGIDARLVVVAMTATEFSIADPADPGMLDVSGFDAAVPSLLASFSRGDV